MPPIENENQVPPGGGTDPRLLPGFTRAPIDPEQVLTVSVMIHRKQPLNLEALGGRVLSREEFDDKYAGDPACFDSLREFAKLYGLSVDESSSSLSRRTLVVRGRASAMEEAFGVKLVSYTSPDGHTVFHAPEGAVHVPGKYASMIEAVLGLDSRPIAKPRG